MTQGTLEARFRAVLAIAGKDLKILSRDKMAVFSLLGIPLMFATFFGAIFGGMASGGGGGGSSRPIEIAVVEPLPNAEAEAFLARLQRNGAVEVQLVSREEALSLVRRGKKSAFLQIDQMPTRRELLRGEAPAFRMGVDPTQQPTQGMLTGLLAEATFQGLGELFADRGELRSSLSELSEDLQGDSDLNVGQRALLRTAFGSFDRFLRGEADPEDGSVPDDGSVGSEAADSASPFALRPSITVESVARETGRSFNAHEISFPQAMAWALMSAAAALALTLVKENRAGTLDRLRTAPIDGQTILLGKTLATAIAGLAALTVLFLIGNLVFGVRLHDPVSTAVAVLCSALGFAALGTLLATLGRTEESVSGASWGILMAFAMLGGGMVPEIAMPEWMKEVAVLSPVRWSIRSLEGASWRAFEMPELLQTCGVLLGFAALFYILGTLRLRTLRG